MNFTAYACGVVPQSNDADPWLLELLILETSSGMMNTPVERERMFF